MRRRWARAPTPVGEVETSPTGIEPAPRSDSRSSVSENRLNSEIGSDKGHNGSQGSAQTGEQAKRSCDGEEDVERLLAEEELMLKACEDDYIPPGLDL